MRKQKNVVIRQDLVRKEVRTCLALHETVQIKLNTEFKEFKSDNLMFVNTLKEMPELVTQSASIELPRSWFEAFFGNCIKFKHVQLSIDKLASLAEA